MTCLTLNELRATGRMIEAECVCCGALEYRSPAALDLPPATAIGALGLGLACRWCGAKAIITTPVTTSKGRQAAE